MIFKEILNNSFLFTDKTAIVYQRSHISYGELFNRVNIAVEHLKNDSTPVFLLNSNDPVQNICDFLAANKLGKPGIFSPKDYKIEIENIYIPENNTSEELKDDDLFLGVLTSGTITDPKIIWKTNRIWERAFSAQSEVFGIDFNDKLFVLNALSYSANLNAALHILYIGGTLVLGDLEKANKWDELFKNEKISSAFLVPSHLRLLTKKLQYNSFVKSLVCAGEKLDSETARDFFQKFPSVLLTEYYGASELGHITYHQNKDIIEKPGSVGKLFPGVKIEIRDNQIYVNSPYFEQNNQKWQSVSDLGYWDGDQLILLGRHGRMFNKRGLNIFAQEIEQIAKGFFGIKECVLIQNENNRICLIFTRDRISEPVDLNEKSLIAYLQSKLGAHKMPHLVREVEFIPRTLSGKIDIKKLSKRPVEEEIKLWIE